MVLSGPVYSYSVRNDGKTLRQKDRIGFVKGRRFLLAEYISYLKADISGIGWTTACRKWFRWGCLVSPRRA